MASDRGITHDDATDRVIRVEHWDEGWEVAHRTAQGAEDPEHEGSVAILLILERLKSGLPVTQADVRAMRDWKDPAGIWRRFCRFADVMGVPRPLTESQTPSEEPRTRTLADLYDQMHSQFGDI